MEQKKKMIIAGVQKVGKKRVITKCRERALSPLSAAPKKCVARPTPKAFTLWGSKMLEVGAMMFG